MSTVIKENRFLKLAVVLITAVLIFMSGLGVSHAADPTATQTATVQINGGTRTVSSGSGVTLPAVGLTGYDTTTAVSLGNVAVTDASGTGAGWHLMVSSPQVAAGSKTLPVGSATIDPVQSVSKQDPTSSTVPSITTSNSAAVDSGAVTLLSSPAGNGMGSYTAALKNLTVNVPANTYAGTYTTNIVYDLATAP
ncbi:WxL domain-containing protein [Sporolactobacillus sp. KGMB 08714]|uniref:WxL domain-containing protein n=1 Tax=Sporolactobacillus sp. KGMB 08714 TaxID=3064704 RepID=UPI002FBE5574